MNIADVLRAMLAAKTPKLGKRYLLGQPRCTWRGKGMATAVDLSERMNAEHNKYVPHQGKRERARRLRQGA